MGPAAAKELHDWVAATVDAISGWTTCPHEFVGDHFLSSSLQCDGRNVLKLFNGDGELIATWFWVGEEFSLLASSYASQFKRAEIAAVTAPANCAINRAQRL